MFFSNRSTLIPFIGRQVPHLVIEVNQKCNISCTACYKDRCNYTKPTKQIISEIDFALQRRDVTVITLAGGEPTLHPDLAEILKHGTSRGLKMQILTNGYELSDKQLQVYKEAGLQELFLHIDSMQNRPGIKSTSSEIELNELRKTLAQRVVAQGIMCSLVMTIYQQNKYQLIDVIKYASCDENITRGLFICCTDFNPIVQNFKRTQVLEETLQCQVGTGKEGISWDEDLSDKAVSAAEVAAILKDKLQMLPFGHIGSSLNEDDKRWYMYHVFSIGPRDGSFKFLPLTPAFGKIAQYKYFMQRRNGEKYTFGKKMTPAKSVRLCLLAALVSLNPWEMLKTIFFLSNLLRTGAKIYYNDFTLQQPPNLTTEGTIEYCRACPDATVRNGKIIPVCMADFVSP